MTTAHFSVKIRKVFDLPGEAAVAKSTRGFLVRFDLEREVCQLLFQPHDLDFLLTILLLQLNYPLIQLPVDCLT